MDAGNYSSRHPENFATKTERTLLGDLKFCARFMRDERASKPKVRDLRGDVESLSYDPDSITTVLVLAVLAGPSHQILSRFLQFWRQWQDAGRTVPADPVSIPAVLAVLAAPFQQILVRFPQFCPAGSRSSIPAVLPC